MKTARTISWTLLLACSCIALLLASAQAQQEPRSGFAVSMASQALQARPGQTVQSELRIVTQNLKQITRYEIQALDLGLTASGSTQPVTVGQGARSCAGWLRVQRNVEVPAEGSLTVPFSIAVPAGAVGEYYAFLQVKNLPERPAQRVVVIVQPAISVKIGVDVPGSRRLELRAHRLSYDPLLVNDAPGMLLEVANTGEAKSDVEGDVLLYGPKGTFPYRARIPMRDEGNPYTVYPGLTQSLKCPFVKAPPPGTYSAQARLLMAGRWRAQSSFEITIPKSARAGVSAATPREKSELDVDVGVSPDFVEVALPAGATRTVAIRVQNRDSVAVRARASVAAVQQETNGFLTYSDIADTSQQWVQVSPAEAELGPHSSSSFLVNIRKANAPSGSAAMCAVRIQGVAGTDPEGWRSEVDIGVPVVAVDPGAPPATVEIEKLEVVRQDPALNPTAAILVVKNAGGHVARLSGKMRVERALAGTPIQTMRLGELGELIIPPGGVREFRMPMPYLDRGQFRLAGEVEIPGQPGSAGKQDTLFECIQGP